MKSEIKTLTQLIKASNKLDLYGMHKSADIIDGVITEVYRDINGDGNLEPVSDSKLGNFEKLDDTNISKDEAFSAGHSVAEDECVHEHKPSYMAKPQLAKIHELSSEIFFMIDGEIEDWQESKIAEMAAAIEDVYNSMKYHTNKHKKNI